VTDTDSPARSREGPLLSRPWLGIAALAVAVAILIAVDHISWLGAIAILGVAGVVFLARRAALAENPDSPSPGADNPEIPPSVRRLAEALPDPCFIVARDGTVRFANDKASAAFGIGESEQLPFRMRYPELVGGFAKVAAGGEPEQVEFTERVPTERTYSAWIAGLDDRNIVIVLDDLTSFHAMERMRADFVANASHELRTPLASLTGFVDTLRGRAKDDSAAREKFLGIMQEQANRMSRLIDDLLSLSRAEMRAHVRPRARVDLVAVLHHVADTMAPLAREMGVTIEAELPEGQVVVRGDRDELVQVFDNLVENACKYGQSGKRVVLRLTASEGSGLASVSVTDFGPGIAPEHLPRLTERFYRVDTDDGRRHRGTGLGLAIVKHIVTRHRARLHIESQPGAGAEFTVHFPEAEASISGQSQKISLDQAHTLS
jgi:two-component system phosphate regulon sensor histidine kinase PhoR